MEHYIAICERLYLVRRLLPWHRNASQAAGKAPLLESFVVEQFVAQAGWTDPDLGSGTTATRTR